MADQVLAGELKLERLTPAAEQGRIRAGKIAIESTLIANEATRRVHSNEGRKNLSEPGAQRVVRPDEKVSGENEPTKLYDGGGDRAAGATGQTNHVLNRSAREIQESQENALEEFAKRKGIWFKKPENPSQRDALLAPDQTKLGGYFKSGMEADVYADDQGKFVYKVIDPNQFSLDILEFLDRVSITNAIFENEGLSVEGYGRDSDDQFFAVVKQPYVRINRGLLKDEASSFMQSLGFKDYDKTFVNEYFIIDDLHSGNIVLDSEGAVRVIDAAVWLNTKEEGYAGRQEFGDLPAAGPGVDFHIGLPSEDIYVKKQQAYALKLMNVLADKGFNTSHPVTSVTDYGMSTYISFTDEAGIERKFRISDHSVTNINRLRNEYHYKTDTDLEKLAERAKKDIHLAVKNKKERDKAFDEDKRRREMLWGEREKMMPQYKNRGLTFRSIERTHKPFMELKGIDKETASNLIATDLGGGAFAYEWTEKKQKGEVFQRASLKYVEEYLRNSEESFEKQKGVNRLVSGSETQNVKSGEPIVNEAWFKEITAQERNRIVERLKKAIPAKVFTSAKKAKSVLSELGYDFDALFGNEVMAFTSHTKKLFDQAKKLHDVGKSPQEIREETGWFVGLDGNWKYTIDDTNVKLLVGEQRIATLAKGKTVDTAKAYPLKGLLSHPEFEQYYPDLADKIKVKFYESQDKNDGGTTENHSDGSYTIRVNKDFREANNWKQVPLTLSHEIQHVIQGLERSVKGNRFADLGGAREGDLYRLLKRGKLKIYREGNNKEIKYSHLSSAKLRRWAWKLYESHSEEIESRASANGNDLKGEVAQLKTPFYWVESVDRDNKVVLKNAKGVQYMRHQNGRYLGLLILGTATSTYTRTRLTPILRFTSLVIYTFAL